MIPYSKDTAYKSAALGGGSKVTDVQIDDASIVEDKVAKIPLADADTFGVVKVGEGLSVADGIISAEGGSDNFEIIDVRLTDNTPCDPDLYETIKAADAAGKVIVLRDTYYHATAVSFRVVAANFVGSSAHDYRWLMVINPYNNLDNTSITSCNFIEVLLKADNAEATSGTWRFKNLGAPQKLTAGEGINITNNVISATGGGGSSYTAGAGITIDEYGEITTTLPQDYDGAKGNVMIGYDASAGYNAERSVTVGSNSSASTDGVAIGASCTGSGQGATAVGHYAYADGQNSIAIGDGAYTQAANTIAIGGGAGAYYEIPIVIKATDSAKIEVDSSGNLSVAGLTDGVTTKSMTEVLAGGGGGSAKRYMHTITLYYQDMSVTILMRFVDSNSTVYTSDVNMSSELLNTLATAYANHQVFFEGLTFEYENSPETRTTPAGFSLLTRANSPMGAAMIQYVEPTYSPAVPNFTTVTLTENEIMVGMETVTEI